MCLCTAIWIVYGCECVISVRSYTSMYINAENSSDTKNGMMKKQRCIK